MRIIKCKNYDEVSRYTADLIASQVIIKPNCVLGLATGSTPIGAYKKLIKMCQDGKVDFSEVKTVNLDEYEGLNENDDQSYKYFMNHNLFWGINIKRENTHIPDGNRSTAEECKKYDELIVSLGGIDMQLLGIGNNGHIGFNEPADVFTGDTHRVELKESTISANSRFFESIDMVPKSAITMGMKSIMSAKKVLLVAAGKKKAEIIEKAIYGNITPTVPASILQLHGDLTVIYTESED